MKKITFFFIFLISVTLLRAQTSNWKIVEGKVTTQWSADVNPSSPLPEYPRPQLVRTDWLNLNGLWQYAIKAKDADQPATFDGSILVPFAVEAALSGVGKNVGKENVLWYKRSFTVPKSFKGKNILLHFGAVDWQCDIFVNGKKVGSHQGGFDPFACDITQAVTKSGTQEIVVRVWDPTDEGPQPRGKQVKNPNGIWYTPVTGIWQTVWIEPVAPSYIARTMHTADIDKKTVTVDGLFVNPQAGDMLKVSAYDGSQKIAEKESASLSCVLDIPAPKLWSPEHPFLYTLDISLVRKGKIVDVVKSYFAMRKISMAPDANGVQRMLLNNEFVFQYGPLDQGWWPDGLYTAPTDEALKFDVEQTKAMGFNMIRKHVKVEPARWYRYCDELGMLVWQDMPSGDLGNRWDGRPGIVGLATSRERSAESEKIYKTEWKAIMDANYNFPSIVVWVPFNEAWGQFKTNEIVKWTMEEDPSRLVNTASGGNFHPVGHIIDLHNYPEPAMPDPELYGNKYAIVLGEFGGLGLPVEGHTWQVKDNWGYQSFKTQEELLQRYSALIDRFPDLIKRGLSAALYTQTTDVEVEINGIMTYDRKVMKMAPDKLKAIHSKLYDTALVK